MDSVKCFFCNLLFSRFVFSLHSFGGSVSIGMDGKQDLCLRSVGICVFEN